MCRYILSKLIVFMYKYTGISVNGNVKFKPNKFKSGKLA